MWRTLARGNLVLLGVWLVAYWARGSGVLLWLALCLPALPIAGWAVGQDLVLRGRSLAWRWGRFAPVAMGGAVVVCQVGEMTGGGGAGGGALRGGSDVTLVQWNVRWGGKGGGASAWQTMVGEIRRRGPDVVVLSETPGEGKVRELLAGLGEGWSSVRWDNGPHAKYLFGLCVCSRWGVREGGRFELAEGRAMVVEVLRPEGVVRVLVIDAVSDPWRAREGRMREIDEVRQKVERDRGRVHVVAGDFNTTARHRSFAVLEGAGYRLASRQAQGWRGTWPAPCALYDIDHVWVSGQLPVSGCELFGGWPSDHRGQVVRFTGPTEGRQVRQTSTSAAADDGGKAG